MTEIQLLFRSAPRWRDADGYVTVAELVLGPNVDTSRGSAAFQVVVEDHSRWLEVAPQSPIWARRGAISFTIDLFARGGAAAPMRPWDSDFVGEIDDYELRPAA